MTSNRIRSTAVSTFIILAEGLGAQWCVPTTLIPYDANMPGITHFILNTIDRTSAGMEHYPNNNYTNTGLGTVLVKGQSYPITINFSIDAQICPDMNLRVWVDLNHNDQLDDAGETLLSVDHRLPTSYTGTITIPTTAMTGTTRLRVTAKMSSAGGHTLPTPCDNPADPAGYHGEMEDYDVSIVNTVGIEEFIGPVESAEIFPSPISAASVLRIVLARNSALRIEVLDAFGRQVTAPRDLELNAGEHLLTLEDAGTLANGTYYFRITTGTTVRIIRSVRAE